MYLHQKEYAQIPKEERGEILKLSRIRMVPLRIFGRIQKRLCY
jgi:hypothetical protein